MARSSFPKLPQWCRIVRSNPAQYERDVFSSEPMIGPRAAAAMLRPSMEREEVEVFVVMALNAQHRVLGLSRISQGATNMTLVMPREVFRAAIAMNATAIIVAHNHPSGDPTPSADDRNITAQLAAGGRVLDIPIFDHIIIGAGDRFTSFAQEGFL